MIRPIARALAAALFLSFAPARAVDLPEAEQLSRGAAAHFAAGRYREALGLMEKAQELRLAALGPEHEHSIESARRIAVVRAKMGENAKAMPEFERLLSVSTRALGERHATTLQLLGDFGAALANQGLFERALPFNEKAYRQQVEVHGERDPRTLSAQSNYAANLGRLGRSVEAVTMLESNIALLNAAQGPAAPATLNALSQLAVFASAAGQLKKAFDASSRCLGQAARLPESQPDRLGCALQRAHALRLLSRYSDAVAAFRAALDVAERQYGPRHWTTLDAKSGLASALDSSGEYAAALTLAAEVYETRRAAFGTEHPTTLNDGAAYVTALQHAGRVEDSVKLAREVWDTARRTLGAGHPGTQVFLANYAVALHEAGRTREALAITQDRLAAAKAALGDEHVDTLTMLHSIATFQARLGQQREALAGYEALYETARRALGFTHEKTLQAQRNVAYIYEELGRFREAADLYRQGLAARRQLFGEDSLQAVDLATDLAVVLSRQDRHDEAMIFSRQAYEARVRQVGEDHIGATRQAQQYALELSYAGRHAEAVALGRHAVDLRRTQLGDDHPQTLEALDSLGLILDRAGRNAQAIAIYEQVLEAQLRVHGEAHPRTLTTLNNLVLPYATGGRTEDALGMARRAVEAAEKLRREQILSPESRQAFLDKWTNLYRNHAILAGDTGRHEESFQASELLKARTLIESSLLRDAAARLPKDAQAGLAQLEVEIAALNERLAAIGRQPSLRALVEADKNRKVAELQALWQGQLARDPELAARMQPAAVSLRELTQQLPADTGLLSFVLLGDRALVYLITSERALAQKTPNHPGLTDSIRAFRELLGRRTEGTSARGTTVWKLADGSFLAAAARPAQAVAEATDAGELAQYLGDKLLAPVYPHLAGKKRWIVSPDGELALLPIESLRVGGGMVLARHDVSVVPAMSLLPLLARRERDYAALTGRKTLLAMGGANYGSHQAQMTGVSPRPTYTVEEIAKLIKLRRGGEDETARGFGLLGVRWHELPGSEREVDAIGALFPASDVTLLKRDEATETRLRALNDSGELQKYRYLHFAAHGYLSTEEPALSSLVLGATPGEDGYVTAADWARYRLKSDLVVLSACNTGIGRLVRGEGIVGLPYALFLAGARNTLMTLWPVHDAATAEFMTRFFAHLRQGVPQAAALAETKRAFARHPRYSREEYWVPFVLYGS